MAQRRKSHSEEHEEEGPSSERWLLTYADMITLLMVLFIVLFAMGQTDIRKFNAFKDSFHQLSSTVNDNTPQGGPGILSQPAAIALTEANPYARLNTASANAESGEKQVGQQSSGQAKNGTNQGGTSSPAQQHQSGKQANGQQHSGQDAVGHQYTEAVPATAAGERSALTKAEAEMEKDLQKMGLAQAVTFGINARGLVVTILTNKVVFPTDSAQIQTEGTEIISAISPVLAVLPNQIDIEGDTDNQAIHGGPYANNWALSAARAVSVLDDLINHHGIDPDRLQATGNGDTRPVVPNNTPQHQAENRRVEIVIFSTTVVTP
jgi:chemotaxis protein MotB